MDSFYRCFFSFYSLYEVATVSQYFDYRFECIPKPIWSMRNPKTCDDSGIAGIWCLAESLPGFSSSISCIKKFSGNFSDTTQDGSSFRHALYPNQLFYLSHSVCLIWCPFFPYPKLLTMITFVFLDTAHDDHFWIRSSWWFCLYPEST